MLERAYGESLRARDVRKDELERLRMLREYVSRLSSHTSEKTPSAAVLTPLGQGLESVERLARENLKRLEPLVEKMATQSGPLSWDEARPITRSILMLRHLGQEYVKAERVLRGFREALEALA